MTDSEQGSFQPETRCGPQPSPIEFAIQWMRRAALTSPDRHAVPALFVRWARRLSGQDFAALALPTSGQDYDLRFADGTPPASDSALPAPLSREHIREVIDQGRPMMIPSMGNPEFTLIPYWSAWSRRRAVLVIAAHPEPRCRVSIGPGDLQLLSECTAAAVELARHRRRARVAEMVATTARASEDLHDRVIQSLVADGFEIQAAALAITDPDLRSQLAGVTRNLDEIIDRLRGTIFELSHALPPLPANLLDDLLADTAGLGTPTGLSILVDAHPIVVDMISDRTGRQIRDIVRAVLPASARVSPPVSAEVVVEPIGADLRLSIRQSRGPDQYDTWRAALSRSAQSGSDGTGEPTLARSTDDQPAVSWSTPLDSP